MLFCTQQFLLFFTLVFAAYWALPWHRARVWCLLGASFYFYASWNRWLALIVVVSTTLDYFLALGIQASVATWRRRALVSASVCANLGLLCYFKYANFFLDSLRDLLHSCGAAASLPTLSVILPVGISFYTFEAISYTVDVYRRRIPAERNLSHFMLFILFFPHLVAGPVVRARDFLPQARRRTRFSWLRLGLGARLFLLGLVKKLVIADHLALFADPVFADPAQFGTRAVWVAAVAYALQIYCDFSGYSDMAIGTAHLLGYKLSLNFNMPYLSANVGEFWRRWHMSLSGWLRDYLFIPLGGSKGGRWATARNLLVTMTLGGLWHGASWTFVLWGLLQGLLLCLHRGFQGFCASRPALDRLLRSRAGTASRVTATFVTFALTWVVFRSLTLGAAGTMVWRMLVPCGGRRWPLPLVSFWCLLAVVVLGHALARSGLWQRAVVRLPAPVLGFGYAAACTLALVLAPDAGKAFIYFQF
jgi:alginate O-acetyltransferase complex protein AlgI